MFKTWVGKFDKKVFCTLAVLSVTAAALFLAVPGFAQKTGGGDFAAKSFPQVARASGTDNLGGTTIPGTGVGAIPDDAAPGCGAPGGAPLNITFNSAVTGTLTDVEVNFTGTHTWVGDLDVSLIAPGGATHKILAFTGSTTATGCGADDDLAGLYSFSDTAVGNWWTEAGTASPMAPGSYRTSTAGGVVGGGAISAMNPVFAAVNPTGTWTLRVIDNGNGDTGSITAANLILTAGPAVVNDANVDFNGDGKTDYVVARGTTTPLAEGAEAARVTSEIINRPRSDMEEREVKGRRRAAADNLLAPPIYWYTSFSGFGATSVTQWGDAASDFITPEDFDGDGRDDIAVWRDPMTVGGQSTFFILQSGTGTARIDSFGLSGDDPAIVGDYDGDNKADPAVFRCPAFGGPDGQCFFFYRGSNANPSGNITYIPWGFGVSGDFFPLIGDFDGDGKYDFCIQGSNPSAPSQGLFYLAKSAGGIEYVNWGLSSDFLIPGDYDGDGKADFCVRRTQSGLRQHYLLTRTGAQSQFQWGISGDVSVPGDYDGDGKTDFAIWRGNTDPAQNYFWVRNSSNGATSQFEWGQCATISTCDSAVAGWAVH